MSVPRFHCPGLPDDGEVVLPDDAAHHARTVLRLRVGDPVRLFDGRGREVSAELRAVSAREVRARMGTAVTARPESPLWLALALAPLKGDRFEWALQKAVELGVTELHPVLTARTDSAARPALRGARHERWQRVIAGACEQSGRACVPALAPACTLDELLRRPFEGTRLLFCERPGQTALASLPRATRVLALVGPEGGWEDAELQAARDAGFVCVGLGPRVLRAETAAIAAAAALQTLWGDLA